MRGRGVCKEVGGVADADARGPIDSNQQRGGRGAGKGRVDERGEEQS